MTESADRPVSKCQQALAKSLKKCQDAQLKAFNECKKAGLKDREAPFLNAEDLKGCFGADPKEKIAKACDAVLGRIRLAIDTKCEGDVLPAASPWLVSLPGCHPEDPNDPWEPARCMDERVKCRTCLMVNQADGLDQDCDQFDDGGSNGSCP
jgi:hypothetical protein